MNNNENKELLEDKLEQDVAFEEMESAEEFGAAQDFLTGLGIGVSIVAGIVAIT